MKASDRLRVQRMDQISVYPRRIYRRNTRYNPYSFLTAFDQQQQKNAKIENSNSDDLSNHSSEHHHLINGEISSDTGGNLLDDQVVIPNEQRYIKQRIPLSINNQCANCQQRFKTKQQFHAHLSKCQMEIEPK